MTCTVTGNVIDLRSQPAAGLRLTFGPIVRGIARFEGSATVPEPVTLTADASGDFSVALLPGVYTVRSQSGTRASVQIVVPDAAGANFADIMNLTPPPPLSDAEQAEQAAQGYAAQAYLAANAPRDQELTGGGFSARHFTEVTIDIAQDVTDKAETVNTQHGEILEARDTITTTEETIAGHVAAVNEDRSAIVTLEETIAGHVSAIDQDRAAIVDLEQTISGHVTSIDEDRAAIVALEEAIGGHAQTATDKAQEAATSAEDAAAVAPSLAAAIGNVSAILGQSYEEIERLSEAQEGDAYTLNLVLEIASLIGTLSDQVNGGQVTLRGGTLADPALRIGTVGVYSSAADTLSIAIAGSEVARFTSLGVTIYGTVTESS